VLTRNVDPTLPRMVMLLTDGNPTARFRWGLNLGPICAMLASAGAVCSSTVSICYSSRAAAAGRGSVLRTDMAPEHVQSSLCHTTQAPMLAAMSLSNYAGGHRTELSVALRATHKPALGALMGALLPDNAAAAISAAAGTHLRTANATSLQQSSEVRQKCAECNAMECCMAANVPAAAAVLLSLDRTDCCYLVWCAAHKLKHF
jgi:hypothetical protein